MKRSLGGNSIYRCVMAFAMIFPSVLVAGDIDRNVLGETTYQAKVKRGLCPSLPDDYCIPYQVYIGPTTDEPDPQMLSDYLAVTQGALDAWAVDQKLNLEFRYQGLSETGEIPYVYETDEEGELTDEIKIDSRGQKVIAGDFLISFVPPQEIEINEKTLATSMKYVELPADTGGSVVTGETQWGAIFLNPQFDSFQGCNTICYAGLDRKDSGYDVKEIIAQQMGRLIGLAPSALRSSLMYPFVANGPSQARIAISQDDSLWAQALYRADENFDELGEIRGRIVSGESGKGLGGVHLLLILASRSGDFTQSLDSSLATVAAFSRSAGKFEFPQVPPGDYYLLAEPIDSRLVSSKALDRELLGLISEESQRIEVEFYDGANRESNQESLTSFSPQAIAFAAQINVRAGEAVEKIEMITNVFDPSLETLTAVGSSSETLSQLKPSDAFALIRNELEDESRLAPPPEDEGGGCVLTTNKRQSQQINWLFIACFVWLILGWALRRSNKPSDQSRRLQDQ